MSGPIVRTGTTPKFWQNWDRIFGDKPAEKSAKSAGRKAATAKAATKAKPKAKKK